MARQWSPALMASRCSMRSIVAAGLATPSAGVLFRFIYFSGAIEGETTINFSSSEACSKCRPAAERKMRAACGSLMSRANSRQCSAWSR
jgi:hypothetical protein